MGNQSSEPRLSAFFEEAGRSLTEAQSSLVGELQLPSSLVIANAELELKAAVGSDAEGNPTIKTISAQDLREGAIDPGVLSTLRISFLPAASDSLQSPAEKPARAAEDVIAEVRKRQELATLEKILGKLVYKATYMAETRRWLITVVDSKNRLVRETIVGDMP